MPLTPQQRRRLPDSAFAYPTARKYPMPTPTQARRAGISETQRLGLIRNARAQAAKTSTIGTPARIAKVARTRTTAAQVPAVHGRAARRRSM
jgi:hypothetical protein